ncbi:MAG TPA: uroporphyrinogen decarboxylase [bacterium]|nr:uroporphyrinogen decarboxylase [bacterium]
MAPTSDRTNRFLRACRGESVDVTPVWFMRQAGRYMAEYRKIREKATLLEICRDPALCTEVTLQPLALGVDAAILFADILLPLEPMGAPFHFAKGEGPVIEKPVRGKSDVDALRILEKGEGLEYVYEDIRAIRKALDGKVPLIGFAGAPFTLASYLIEAGSDKSKNFAATKTMMYSDAAAWHSLMEKLARTVLAYLREQVKAGAQALQLFDSWVGCLAPADYREFVRPHSKLILDGVKDLGVPVIHFGVDTATILADISSAGGDVIGVDWRLPLDEARKIVPGKPLQGNLDPVAFFAPFDALTKRAGDVLARAKEEAAKLGGLSRMAYAGTKQRLRGKTIAHIRATLADDMRTLLSPPSA